MMSVLGDLVVVPRRIYGFFLAKIIGPYQYVHDSEFEGFFQDDLKSYRLVVISS